MERALPFLPPVIADMVRLQLLTGMRPSEVCGMCPGEINKSLFPDRWLYEPAKHKNAWRGKKRTILLGQAAREIIDRNNSTEAEKPVFGNHEQEPFREMLYSQILKRIQKRTGYRNLRRISYDTRRLRRSRWNSAVITPMPS
ncbi:hypothetical protein FACS189419_00340 [Planctomycetales bacterium]|nr:hypothetical protein FACS189419_00340 [Planctomycetales bacterium]